MIRHLLGRTQLRAASQPHILALTRLSQQAAAGSHKFEATDGMRRKLIYRAKQRGWLEMDLILGDWAATNLVDMEEFQLRQFEEILDMENPDLFKWLTGQEAVPEEIDSVLFVGLRDHVKAQFQDVPVPRGVEEWSSRKWWSEEITDEMRERMATREAGEKKKH
eukprot:TRINITY_DN38200_c0_g1_i2.p1 TRINITY_DN38200_c0_g1~~TRINITY_DN38200_c0_g1_i2.p1  ORF type:complete len:164 (-),score=62.87 TRINITY_DN38200_c0_g1_i2:268-759(-)